MTRKQHQEAYKCLKEVKKLTLSKQVTIKGDIVRIEYKQRSTELSNGMSLVISGSMEQHNTIHCTTESTFLVISLEDKKGEDLGFTLSQHAKFSDHIKKLLKV